jgi:hypothetical protein
VVLCRCGLHAGRRGVAMNNEKIRAVRALNRVWFPIDTQLEIIAEADRGFDRGEWSDVASANTYEREWWNCLARVAPRFGLTAQELNDAVSEYEWHQTDCIVSNP